MISDNLNCSQIRVLYKYINDGYVIINSGRRSGKTQTLIAIADYWIEHQAQDRDICVIVGNNYIQFYRHFYDNMIKGRYKYVQSCTYRPAQLEFIKWNGCKYYIEFYKTKEEYFNRKHNNNYAGTHITLLVGDECYINPKWCAYTACAYTQYPGITALEYNSDVRSDILKLKNVMNKNDFDRNFGQYL